MPYTKQLLVSLLLVYATLNPCELAATQQTKKTLLTKTWSRQRDSGIILKNIMTTNTWLFASFRLSESSTKELNTEQLNLSEKIYFYTLAENIIAGQCEKYKQKSIPKGFQGVIPYNEIKNRLGLSGDDYYVFFPLSVKWYGAENRKLVDGVSDAIFYIPKANSEAPYEVDKAGDVDKVDDEDKADDEAGKSSSGGLTRKQFGVGLAVVVVFISVLIIFSKKGKKKKEGPKKKAHNRISYWKSYLTTPRKA